jgi:hypothetical protein
MKLHNLFAIALLVIAAGAHAQSTELFNTPELARIGVRSGQVLANPGRLTLRVDASTTTGVTMLKVVASKGTDSYASPAVVLGQQAYYEMTVNGLSPARTGYTLVLLAGDGSTTTSLPLDKVKLNAKHGDNKYDTPDAAALIDTQRADDASDSLSNLIDSEMEKALDKLALQGASAQQISKAKDLAKGAIRAAIVKFYNRQVADEDARDRQRFLSRSDRRKTISTQE